MTSLTPDRWVLDPIGLLKLYPTFALGTLVTLYIIYQTLLKPFILSPLRRVPGPKLAAITEWYMTWYIVKGARTLHIHSLHEKYGNIVRIGPDEVSVTDRKAITEMFSQGTPFLKSKFYETQRVLDMSNPGIFSMRDKIVHSNRRRMLSNAFSRSNILTLEEMIIKEANMLLHQFAKRSVSKEKVDILLWMRFLAADVTSKLLSTRLLEGIRGVLVNALWDYSADMVEKGEVHPTIEALDNVLFISAMSNTFGPAFYALEYLSKLFPKENKLRSFFESKERNFGPFCRQVFYDYIRTNDPSTLPEKKDILSKMLIAKDSQGQKLSEHQIICEVANLQVAGTDTTSSTLTYLIWRLMTTPNVKFKLQQELDEKIPDPLHTFPDFPTLEKFPYLKACIMETLRLHSAAPASMPRLSPEGGYQIQNYFLPQGTTIDVQPYSVHRIPEVFGKDVNEWKPERWLKEDNKALLKYFFPFSQGPANCLGINVAYLELYTVTARVMRFFDAKVAPDYPADGMSQLVPKAHRCDLIFSMRQDVPHIEQLLESPKHLH